MHFNTFNATKRKDQCHVQLGGSVALNPVRLYAMWALEQNQFSFFAITPARKSQSYEAGVRLAVGRGEVLSALQARCDQDWDANLATWGLGYTHPLSKRSNLYGLIADTRANARLTPVAAGGEGYTVAQIKACAVRDHSQFGLGLRHLF